MVIMALSEENKEIEREKRNSYMKDYRKTERSKEYMKKYRKENREHLNKLKSESQKRNRDSANIRSARLRAKPERKEYEKKWRLEHRKELNEYNKKLKLNNKEYYLACRLRSSLNKALTRYSNNKDFPTIFSKYDIDINKIIQHLLPIPENRKDYHIDHIKPLCSFDLTKEEEIKEAFSPNNLRWLLAKENLSKGGGADKLLKIRC